MTDWRDLFDEGPVLYEDLARLLDPKISSLQDEAARQFDPDEALECIGYVSGIFGLGLVVAQEWMVTTFTQREVPRDAALALGPALSSGESIAQLVVHGANYWKHAGTWDWENPDDRQRRVRDALVRAGVCEDGDIPWELMAVLTGEEYPKLGSLSPALREWYVDLRRVYPRPGL